MSCCSQILLIVLQQTRPDDGLETVEICRLID